MRLLILLTFFASIIYSQSLPVFLDGRVDEWITGLPEYEDDLNDGNNFDFHQFTVTNDENFLYLKLHITPETKLLEDNFIFLYLDGDNNFSTGVQINNIGAELKWGFGIREGLFFFNGTTSIHFPDIKFRSLPTVTDTVYEIAIGRNVKPDGTNFLFTSDTIKILFRDEAVNGDWMPDEGEVFQYKFDDSPTEPLVPVEITKEDTSLVRIMNYNVEFDGLLDPQRAPSFERILNAINPDIICFNEFFNSNLTQVKDAVNQMLPLPNGQSWYGVKLDYGNVTLSRYPIIQSWEVYPDHRLTASLIDLPDYLSKDVLVVNSHFKCCGGISNDETRQREADSFISFILDAKSPGGEIDLPTGTPFMILGDLNLVGLRQQLTTLVTGEIINTGLFGNGAPPDWDDSDLFDLLSAQTDKRTAYTWRNDQSSFPPGRLDFMIYSNSVMSAEKHFVLQTEVMDTSRLNQYGLLPSDTKTASDHFPKVADFSIDFTTGIKSENNLKGFKLEQNYPNPFNPSTKIKFTIPTPPVSSPLSKGGTKEGFVTLKVYDVLGNEITTLVNEYKPAGNYEVSFYPELSGKYQASNIYFYHLKAGEHSLVRKMIYLK